MTPPSPRGRRGHWGDWFFPAAPAGKLRGWRRPIASVLSRIGPTWRSSPVRRIIQASCLALFLVLFFRIAWPYATNFSSRVIADKQFMPLESFLWIDPLLGISTAIAARAWNIALIGTAAIALICLLFPRGFCGYICPLGTLIDTFDFLIGRPVRWTLGILRPAARDRRVRRETAPASKKESPARPWWVWFKYSLLAAILIAAACGVLFSGYVAAIPVLTRGLLLSAGQLQLGLAKNWGLVPPFTGAVWVSLSLFALVFLLGLIRPRFWCRYVCPSGALFSVFNLFRVSERKVEKSCIACNKCAQICPFDAIKSDFTTRTLDCTFCQTCGGVCPTSAIKFVQRWNDEDLKTDCTTEDTEGTGGRRGESSPPIAPMVTDCEANAGERPSSTNPPAKPLLRVLRALRGSNGVSRRGIVLGAVGGAMGAVSALATRAASPALAAGKRPIRPPGSVPEDQFLDLCIRCGECFKVCPGPVLQEAGLSHGLEGLWTPVAVMTHAGCHPDCNFCTRVCPTRAIVPLTIGQKRKTPMGLALVNPAICLPHTGKEDCKLCYDECEAAGYHAIELREIKLKVGDIPEGAVSDDEREQMGKIQAPFVLSDRCTGCGLCEYRCNGALVHQKKKISRSAIVVVAEDRRKSRPIR